MTQTPQETLCENCRHVRIIQTPRGSTFYMCLLSSENDGFKKYPPQPVFACQGYKLDHEIQTGEADNR